jgi:hypothetical protein
MGRSPSASSSRGPADATKAASSWSAAFMISVTAARPLSGARPKTKRMIGRLAGHALRFRYDAVTQINPMKPRAKALHPALLLFRCHLLLFFPSIFRRRRRRDYHAFVKVRVYVLDAERGSIGPSRGLPRGRQPRV